MDKYCFPFTRGRVFSTVEKDTGQYDDTCKIFWASGTAFLTHKHIFDKLDGFDETLFAHMEEIDYHWKCQMLGYEIWVEPQSVVYHHNAITLPATSAHKTYLNYRNSLILLLSNYPPIVSLQLIFPRIIMEFLSLIKEVIFFRWNHALAIFRSWIWILFHLGYVCRRRRKFGKIQQLNNIYKKSIVVKYFLMQKKTYREL